MGLHFTASTMPERAGAALFRGNSADRRLPRHWPAWSGAQSPMSRKADEHAHSLDHPCERSPWDGPRHSARGAQSCRELGASCTGEGFWRLRPRLVREPDLAANAGNAPRPCRLMPVPGGPDGGRGPDVVCGSGADRGRRCLMDWMAAQPRGMDGGPAEPQGRHWLPRWSACRSASPSRWRWRAAASGASRCSTASCTCR